MRSKFSRNVRKNSRKTRKQYGGADAAKAKLKVKAKNIEENVKGNVKENVVTVTKEQLYGGIQISGHNKQYVKDRLFVLYDNTEDSSNYKTAEEPNPTKPKINLYHLGNSEPGNVSHIMGTNLAYVDYGGLGDRNTDQKELKMFTKYCKDKNKNKDLQSSKVFS